MTLRTRTTMCITESCQGPCPYVKCLSVHDPGSTVIQSLVIPRDVPTVYVFTYSSPNTEFLEHPRCTYTSNDFV